MKGLQEECGPNQKTIGSMGEASLTDGTVFPNALGSALDEPEEKISDLLHMAIGKRP
jgi:hypothetical protein